MVFPARFGKLVAYILHIFGTFVAHLSVNRAVPRAAALHTVERDIPLHPYKRWDSHLEEGRQSAARSVVKSREMLV